MSRHLWFGRLNLKLLPSVVVLSRTTFPAGVIKMCWFCMYIELECHFLKACTFVGVSELQELRVLNFYNLYFNSVCPVITISYPPMRVSLTDVFDLSLDRVVYQWSMTYDTHQESMSLKWRKLYEWWEIRSSDCRRIFKKCFCQLTNHLHGNEGGSFKDGLDNDNQKKHVHCAWVLLEKVPVFKCLGAGDLLLHPSTDKIADTLKF